MTDVQIHDPQTLYRHWEDAQWNPFAIALDADREQWPQMSGKDRGLVHWALSSLMVAEERITKFAGLVLAHGTEEEATFPRHPVGRRGAPHAVLRALPGRGHR